MSKASVYDDQIAPLMQQIITICEEHKINMAAQFSLGLAPDPDDPNQPEAPLWCTTCLPIDETDGEGLARMRRLALVMLPGSPLTAIMIASGVRP